MQNTSDNQMNPQLREQVQGLRGVIANNAHKNPIPERFTCEPLPDRPAVIITDSQTGNKTVCQLFAYGAVRATPPELLGDVK